MLCNSSIFMTSSLLNTHIQLSYTAAEPAKTIPWHSPSQSSIKVISTSQYITPSLHTLSRPLLTWDQRRAAHPPWWYLTIQLRLLETYTRYLNTINSGTATLSIIRSNSFSSPDTSSMKPVSPSSLQQQPHLFQQKLADQL